MDVADESVPLQERLVLLRAIGRVRPDAGAGVRGGRAGPGATATRRAGWRR